FSSELSNVCRSFCDTPPVWDRLSSSALELVVHFSRKADVPSFLSSVRWRSVLASFTSMADRIAGWSRPPGLRLAESGQFHSTGCDACRRPGFHTESGRTLPDGGGTKTQPWFRKCCDLRRCRYSVRLRWCSLRS